MIFFSEIFDLQMVSDETPYQDSFISDFLSSDPHEYLFKESDFVSEKELSVLHCEDADFYISPPELTKTV